MEYGLQEIANKLGISVSTVSRVVNNKSTVKESTRQKVLKCLDERGYSAVVCDSDESTKKEKRYLHYLRHIRVDGLIVAVVNQQIRFMITVNSILKIFLPLVNSLTTVPAERVICIRMDLPICDEEFKIPFGQYSVELDCDVPVCACFGRLDRRHNLGYYTTGYCCI